MEINKDDFLLINNIVDNLLYQQNGSSLELIIRPDCNQKCKYCYITQHKKELYPNECGLSKEHIVKNLTSLIDHYIKKEYLILEIELFAGDLFFDDLFFDIMPIIKKYFLFLNTKKDFLNNITKSKNGVRVSPVIIIPCNMSFCHDDLKIERVVSVYNEFKEIGVELFLSYSTDGKYSIDVREQRNIDNKYFDKVFSLCEKMNWGVHPMISYEGIDCAIDNYNWFRKKFQQYYLNNGSDLPYYLEVRNDGWTEETIEKYVHFLKYYLNNTFHNAFSSDLGLLFDNYFSVYEKKENGKYTYKPIKVDALGKLIYITDKRPTCGLGIISLIVNVADLSIVPCHRLSYPELRGAKYKNENNELVLYPTDFMNSYLNITHCNNLIKPGCATCIYNHFCIKGCLGAQYEVFADAMIPIPSVCNLLKAKINTLFHYYHSIKLFHYMFLNEQDYPLNSIFRDMLIELGYEEYKNYTQLGDFSNVE